MATQDEVKKSRKEYQKQWRAENIEQVRASARERSRRYREKYSGDPSHVAKQRANDKRRYAKRKHDLTYQSYRRNKHLMRTYGLTTEDVKEMHTYQLGQCEICGDPLQLGHGTHVDHCHETGAVRSLLCRTFNAGLGLFKDDLYSLQNAFTYVLNHANRGTT